MGTYRRFYALTRIESYVAKKEEKRTSRSIPLIMQQKEGTARYSLSFVEIDQAASSVAPSSGR
jgi:hypothetical protein